MAEYRATITTSEPTANGMVHLDAFLYRVVVVDEEETLVLVPGGHRTMELHASALHAAIASGETLAQKRNAVLALMGATASEWGIAEADAANEALLELLPGGAWPVTVTLEI